jgi:hypothetical protein
MWLDKTAWREYEHTLTIPALGQLLGKAWNEFYMPKMTAFRSLQLTGGRPGEDEARRGFTTLHNRRMPMHMSRLGICTVCVFMMISAGCTTYYRVIDPASGKEYYTTSVDEKGKSGAVKIKDDRTGSSVTLQSSEVREISADEYKAATGKR